MNLTDTPAFKRWFGDSNVVDDEGKPLVVYHGTNEDFTEFSEEFIGEGDGNADWGDGFYFTNNAEAASGYANSSGANVIPVYLRIINPATADVMMSPEVQDAMDDGMGFASVQEVLEEMGHDGIAIGHGKDGIEYIVFNPTQIKSAIGNNGEFDGTNPDITK